MKKDSLLITYQSGNASSQVDYILFKRRDFKSIRDVKVIPSEECVTQHKLVVCDLLLKTPPEPKKKAFVPKLRCWKLKDPDVSKTVSETFATNLAGDSLVDSSVEGIWARLKTTLLNTADEVCVGSPKRGLEKGDHLVVE